LKKFYAIPQKNGYDKAIGSPNRITVLGAKHATSAILDQLGSGRKRGYCNQQLLLGFD
jgi:hypothetical protein